MAQAKAGFGATVSLFSSGTFETHLEKVGPHHILFQRKNIQLKSLSKPFGSSVISFSDSEVKVYEKLKYPSVIVNILHRNSAFILQDALKGNMKPLLTALEAKDHENLRPVKTSDSSFQ